MNEDRPLKPSTLNQNAMQSLLALCALCVAGPAFAQSANLDPAGSGVILGAVNWVQGTLLGAVATSVAVIAVAGCGFMMLTGRMNWRYGGMVILGTFILFGASAIVGGIRSAATGF
jgi:type IV secretion system protein VirB2